jgi:hypothetical protein
VRARAEALGEKLVLPGQQKEELEEAAARRRDRLRRAGGEIAKDHARPRQRQAGRVAHHPVYGAAGKALPGRGPSEADRE